MTDMIRELRYASRMLVRTPGFTVTAIVALALGIGVNSVMFSLVDAVLFRPLPVRDAERVVRVGMTDERGSGFGGLSYPLLRDLSADGEAFTALAGFAGGMQVNLGIGEGQVERVTATAVSGGFFELLGVGPSAGRLLGPEDDTTPGGHPVMVLSEAYWRRRFGADPGAIGSPVRLNTEVFTIVGVLPRGFHGPTLDEVPDVWIPLTMAVQATPGIAQFMPYERRGFTWVDAVGRLNEGVSAEQATVRLDTINARINQELALDTSGDRYSTVRVVPLAAAAVSLDSRDDVRRTSWILMGVTALVLLTACAVVAGLLLARGERRQREVAVRCAIGASRRQIVRQLLTESLLLAGAAAVLGLLLATWSVDLFMALAPARFPLPMGAATPILDWRALGFTAGLALVSALAFGLLPARRAARANLVEAIKPESAWGPARGPRMSLRNAFVVTQVALSAVLLVGAGLLLRTLERASSVDLGFDTAGGLVISVDVSRSGYDPERGLSFYRQLLEDVRRIPGVRGAAISRHVPVSGNGNITSIELTNFTPPEGGEPRVGFTSVSSGYFETLGIRLERGRDFAPGDENAPSRLIVNRAFADRFWPGRDPLQERVLNFGEHGAEVIGVAANVKQFSIREAHEPMIYVPDFAFYMADTNLILRTEGEPRSVVAAVVAVVRDLDPGVPLSRIRTLTEHAGIAIGQERTIASLLAAFAALALGLAAIGLYAVIAYTTQVRTREFGIRLALGALPADLLRSVLAQGARLALVGLAIGLTVAASTSRLLSTLLFGVSPTDRPTFLAIAALLMAVALAASAAPALRAARVDPISTLK